MRRWFVVPFLASLVGAAALASVSCGHDGPSGAAPIVDAAAEKPLDAPVASPDVDAEPPPGDVCGSKAGLSPSAPWPLRGGCSTRAGRAFFNGPQTATVAGWVALPVGESSPAVTANGLVWVGTTDGRVLAVANTGVVRWAYPTGGVVRSSPALDADGRAIVAGGDGVLYALIAVDPEDAGVDGGDDAASADGGLAPDTPPKVSFALPIGTMNTSPVIAADGTIYIGTASGELVSVPHDGSAINWRATTHDEGGSSPALGQDGTIYAGSTDQKLYAFSPNGTQKWALDLGAPIGASPVVGGDGAVYIGTSDGKLHAVSPEGRERWAYATGGAIKASAAVSGGVVYIGSDDKKLHAVSAADGKLRWTYPTLGAVSTPVIGTDGTIYVGSADAHVYALTSKGTLYFAVNAKGPVTTAPAIGFATSLVVTTPNGLLTVRP